MDMNKQGKKIALMHNSDWWVITCINLKKMNQKSTIVAGVMVFRVFKLNYTNHLLVPNARAKWV